MSEQKTIMSELTRLFPEAKKTTLRDMLTAKRVRINGTLAHSMKQPLADKDKVEVTDVGAGGAQATILKNNLKIIHLDADILIVDKPSGLLTATDAQEKRPYVQKLLTEYFQNQNSKNQIHLIHRLDRDASGLLVFARTWDAFRSLKEQFFEHTITRRYDTIVHGIPKKPEAKLENLLLEDPETGVVNITKDMKHGKLAILSYSMLKADDKKKIAHLRCELYTGRKHQIRVQLKANGHPVVADPLYGTADEAPFRLALHASHLAFIHPKTNRPVSFDSPMPGSFGHLFHS